MATPARTARPKAAAPGERLELDLYGEIYSVRDIIATLRANPNADVTLRINSPGGDVIEGFHLANVLRAHAGKKVAVIEGACCSAATFAACACDAIHMFPESFLMVHGPAADTYGGVEDLESCAELLRKMSDLMANMYARKTGADETTVRAWLARDSWMKPDEALAAGFCDEILSIPLSPAARARTARYVALLKPPIRASQPAKNTRNTTMEEKLRDKLAKHGLAEDGGNMEEAYSAYMAETEDGPAERKEMAKAMEEMKEASAKVEDDDKDEESSTGDGKAKARVRADAHSDPAVQRLISTLTGQVSKMSKQVERYESAERKRAEAEFYASAEMHTTRADAAEYVKDCDGDLAKALKLIQKLPKKGGALGRWFAGGSPIGGGSNAAADSYEASRTIRQGNAVVTLHGYGLSKLARKIAAERKCSLEVAYKAAARERPDLAQSASA